MSQSPGVQDDKAIRLLSRRHSRSRTRVTSAPARPPPGRAAPPEDGFGAGRLWRQASEAPSWWAYPGPISSVHERLRSGLRTHAGVHRGSTHARPRERRPAEEGWEHMPPTTRAYRAYAVARRVYAARDALLQKRARRTGARARNGGGQGRVEGHGQASGAAGGTAV